MFKLLFGKACTDFGLISSDFVFFKQKRISARIALLPIIAVNLVLALTMVRTIFQKEPR